LNEDLLKIDGMDKALIGVCMTWNGHMLVERLVYDGQVITETLSEQGMSEEEAQDYIDFNIIGAYVGDSTPIVMWPTTMEEINERP
jgi:hypothetical protein